MERTRHRPLPSGRMTPRAVLLISAGLICAGLAGLAVASGWLAAGLGLLAVVWYNAIYTPLKRRTPFAAVIGAPVGAIPPAVGWVAGGGEAGSPALLILMAFLFLWQVPHFWLLLLARGDDYARAGLPLLTGVFCPPRLRRITFTWTLAMAAACVAFPVFGIARQPWAFALLLMLTAHQTFRATVLLRADADAESTLMSAFNRLNVYTLLVLLLAALDRGAGLWRI
jgi:protoheme IX farnesyltransferase